MRAHSITRMSNTRLKADIGHAQPPNHDNLPLLVRTDSDVDHLRAQWTAATTGTAPMTLPSMLVKAPPQRAD